MLWLKTPTLRAFPSLPLKTWTCFSRSSQHILSKTTHYKQITGKVITARSYLTDQDIQSILLRCLAACTLLKAVFSFTTRSNILESCTADLLQLHQNSKLNSQSYLCPCTSCPAEALQIVKT